MESQHTQVSHAGLVASLICVESQYSRVSHAGLVSSLICVESQHTWVSHDGLVSSLISVESQHTWVSHAGLQASSVWRAIIHGCAMLGYQPHLCGEPAYRVSHSGLVSSINCVESKHRWVSHAG